MNVATQQLIKRMAADIDELKAQVAELTSRLDAVEAAPAIEPDIPARPVLSLKRV